MEPVVRPGRAAAGMAAPRRIGRYSLVSDYLSATVGVAGRALHPAAHAAGLRLLGSTALRTRPVDLPARRARRDTARPLGAGRCGSGGLPRSLSAHPWA